MSDIVDRLCACTRLGDGWWKIDQHRLMADAIDEIVRLRAELARLREGIEAAVQELGAAPPAGTP